MSRRTNISKMKRVITKRRFPRLFQRLRWRVVIFIGLFLSSMFQDGTQSLSTVQRVGRLVGDDLPVKSNNFSWSSNGSKPVGSESRSLKLGMKNKVIPLISELRIPRNSSSSSDWFKSSIEDIDDNNSPQSLISQDDKTNKTLVSRNAKPMTTESSAGPSSWRRDPTGSVSSESSGETLRSAGPSSSRRDPTGSVSSESSGETLRSAGPSSSRRDPTGSVSSESSGETSSSESPISCRGRCGKRRDLPCSCSDVCIVNGNCCPDLNSECPGLVASARVRFSHLLNSEVVCSLMTDTFMVLSCTGQSRVAGGQVDNDPLSPREMAINGKLNSTGKDQRRSFTPLSTPAYILTTQEDPFSTESVPWLSPDLFSADKSDKISPFNNAFISLLLDTPVTDLTTGLVFRNRSVASCNDVLTVNMLFWTVQIKLLTIDGNPRNLKELDEIVSTSVSVYHPPDVSGNSSAGSVCLADATSQCKANYLTDRPELESLCLNQDTVYYNSIGRSSRKVYRNLYCVLCYLGSEENVHPTLYFERVSRTFRLSVIASLSNSGNVKISNHDMSALTIWNALECSLSSSKKENEQCFKTECQKNFEHGPDGVCRQSRKVKFAVGAIDCPFRRSQYLEEKMVALIKCYMKTNENSELNENSTHFDIIYDKRLNRTLIELSAEVYYPYVKRQKNGRRFLRELAMLLYDANFCCGPLPAVAVCFDNSCRLGEQKVRAVTSLDFEETIDQDYTEDDVGTKIDPISNSTMIFCEQKVEPVLGTVGHMVCHHEPVYTSQLSYLHQAANVSCYGDAVGEHALRARQRRACSRSLNLTPSGVLIDVLVSILCFNLMEGHFYI